MPGSESDKKSKQKNAAKGAPSSNKSLGDAKSGKKKGWFSCLLSSSGSEEEEGKPNPNHVQLHARIHDIRQHGGKAPILSNSSSSVAGPAPAGGKSIGSSKPSAPKSVAASDKASSLSTPKGKPEPTKGPSAPKSVAASDKASSNSTPKGKPEPAKVDPNPKSLEKDKKKGWFSAIFSSDDEGGKKENHTKIHAHLHDIHHHDGPMPHRTPGDKHPPAKPASSHAPSQKSDRKAKTQDPSEATLNQNSTAQKKMGWLSCFKPGGSDEEADKKKSGHPQAGSAPSTRSASRKSPGGSQSSKKPVVAAHVQIDTQKQSPQHHSPAPGTTPAGRSIASNRGPPSHNGSTKSPDAAKHVPDDSDSDESPGSSGSSHKSAAMSHTSAQHPHTASATPASRRSMVSSHATTKADAMSHAPSHNGSRRASTASHAPSHNPSSAAAKLPPHEEEEEEDSDEDSDEEEEHPVAPSAAPSQKSAHPSSHAPSGKSNTSSHAPSHAPPQPHEEEEDSDEDEHPGNISQKSNASHATKDHPASRRGSPSGQSHRNSDAMSHAPAHHIHGHGNTHAWPCHPRTHPKPYPHPQPQPGPYPQRHAHPQPDPYPHPHPFLRSHNHRGCHPRGQPNGPVVRDMVPSQPPPGSSHAFHQDPSFHEPPRSYHSPHVGFPASTPSQGLQRSAASSHLPPAASYHSQMSNHSAGMASTAPSSHSKHGILSRQTSLDSLGGAGSVHGTPHSSHHGLHQSMPLSRTPTKPMDSSHSMHSSRNNPSHTNMHASDSHHTVPSHHSSMESCSSGSGGEEGMLDKQFSEQLDGYGHSEVHHTQSGHSQFQGVPSKQMAGDKGVKSSHHTTTASERFHPSHYQSQAPSMHSSQYVHQAPTSSTFPRGPTMPPSVHSGRGVPGAEYEEGSVIIPPPGTLSYGRPFPGIPIIDKTKEFSQKGINADVSQQYIPDGPGSSVHDLTKKASSRLNVAVNKDHKGHSIIYSDGTQIQGAPMKEYSHYDNFAPYGAGQIPIQKHFPDKASNVNVFVRQGPGPAPPPPAPAVAEQEYYPEEPCDPCCPAPCCAPNSVFMPYPIPYPIQTCCPPPPCPPPCCCPPPPPKRKCCKKKKCKKNWDMMSMYGMYTIFQQMHQSWQNQMNEQYLRDNRLGQPPQQYGLAFCNPCQMMCGGGCGPCGGLTHQLLCGGCMPSRPFNPATSCCAPNPNCEEPNPIFEVTGIQVRSPKPECSDREIKSCKTS